MAERLVTVDTGGTGDYTGLSAAITGEASISTDLLGDGDTLRIVCEASTGVADTTGAELSTSWNTGPSNGITIEAGTGYEAVKTGIDSSKYLLQVAGTCLMIRADYVTVSGLQCQNTVASTYGIGALSQTAAANSILIKNCYIDGSGLSGQRGLYLASVDTVGKIENCVVKNWSDCIFISGAISIYNTVSYEAVNDSIEYEPGASGTVENCASFDSGTDFDIDVGATVTITNCASDDGDGTNPQTPADWTAVFNDYINGDVTLLETNDLRNNGIGPGSDSNVPVLDIDGDTRSGTTCDIGVDEYAGVVPPTGVAIFRRRRSA